MTIDEFIKQTTATLNKAGLDTARLDCLVLLEDELGVNRASLLAHGEDPIPEAKLAILNTKIARRITHIPLAYIRGHAPFYGRDFVVNHDVLVPRPESESMINLLKNISFPLEKSGIPTHILDVGTGSGCLGITAALELPQATVELRDIDTEALEVAKLNAVRFDITPEISETSLLEYPFSTLYIDVVLANLPYVPKDYPINQAASHEPYKALFAGPDGMDLYRTFWDQASKLKQQPPHIITESLLSQHDINKTLAAAAGYHLAATEGLAQYFTL